MLSHLFTWILIFGTVGCAFVSKRIESRQNQQETGSTQKAVNQGDDELVHIRIKELERQMKSQREKELYSKLLPWFLDEDEKLEFLSLPRLTEKQEWATEKRIWNRNKNPSNEMKSLMQNQDIAIGMPMDYVQKSWGDPILKEVSGNPLFKNQKWRYARSVSTQEGFKQEKRTVYFEGGKVVGWETD